MITTAHVVLHDQRVPSAGTEPVLIPTERADARRVSVERTEPPLRLGIPKLHDVVIRANCDEVTVSLVANPAHARDEVGLLPQREEVPDVASVGLPKVHALPERHRECVALAPANEVEIIIVHELGRIEYPRRRLGYSSTDRLSRVTQSVLRLGERIELRYAISAIV